MNRLATFLLGALACGAAALANAEDAAWIARSNQYAEKLLELQARYVPEEGSARGLERYDGQVLDMKPGMVARQSADLRALEAQYEQLLKDEADPRVREDLEILTKAARDQRVSNELNERLMLPYFDLPQAMYGGFQQLLDKRTATTRYPAALVRLHRYVGAESGYQPLTQLVQARISERLADPKVTFPWSVELEQALKNQGQYLAGIQDLFKQSGLKGWQKDFATLSAQIDAHGKWLRATLLPRARSSNLLPPEIYADNLKQFGVSMDPRELMERALFSYAQTRDEMQMLATSIARQHGWQSTDYRDVLRTLKKERIPDDKLLEVYRARLAAIEAIIREHHLVTLPQRAAVIRLATAAESAQTPAPHLSLPRLIGNTGEPAEFVIPTRNPNADTKAEMDDFNFDAITWDLTAHEARPGHELQFASMLEAGVSTARAVFAFNSANVEGWGLYSEAIIRPYLSPEAQLAALQGRLMRAARAFLDPMINLGLLKPDQAKAILMDDVVLSEPLAKEEIDRYTFDAPGQATSYFYGFSRLETLRAKTEIALGGKFDALSFHDFLLKQGLLPPDLLEAAVMKDYVRPRLGPG
jgi:uncharacterized protein (DUF885 family)